MTSGGDLGIAAARRLAELNCCDIEPGLTDAEFARIEAEHEFEFADDHRAFLAAGLPVNTPFMSEAGVFHTWDQAWPEWRGEPDDLHRRLGEPLKGVLWEVESGEHWNPAWGEEPDTTEEAVAVARLLTEDVPRLIPVYRHRFLPAGRGTSGHPVLSVHGTDIICYGSDLIDYVSREFGPGRPVFPDDWAPRPTVPFWSDYLNNRW
ncbi:hypothetical protein [Lentzea sp. NPDC092896]|uniref:hypothetical protein n=1 Tax=Lentzea sp. NPDC092896 TaxID=3364127 RepID=UPI0038158EA1